MIVSDNSAAGKTGWHERFAGLAYACAQASSTDAADLLREGWRLLGDAPADWRGSIDLAMDEPSFEALLGAGGEDAAALALLQGWAGFMLSHGPGGCHIATVIVEGLTGEASAEGASAALALLGAAATALAGEELTEQKTLGIQSQTAAHRDHSLRLN